MVVNSIAPVATAHAGRLTTKIDKRNAPLAAQPKRRRPSISKEVVKKQVTSAVMTSTKKDDAGVAILEKREQSVTEENMKNIMRLFMNSEHDESKVFVYFCSIGLLYFDFRRTAPEEFTRFGGGNTGVGISSSRFDDTILKKKAISVPKVMTTWAERTHKGVVFYVRVFYDADEAHKATRDVHVKRIQDGMLHKSNLAGQQKKKMIDFEPEILKQSVYCCKSKCDKGFFITYSLLLPAAFEAELRRPNMNLGVYSRLMVLSRYLKHTRSLPRNKGRVIYSCQDYHSYGHTCVPGCSPQLGPTAEKQHHGAAAAVHEKRTTPKLVAQPTAQLPRVEVPRSAPRLVVGSMPSGLTMNIFGPDSAASGDDAINRQGHHVLSSSLGNVPIWSNVATPTEALTPVDLPGGDDHDMGDVFQFEQGAGPTVADIFAEFNDHKSGGQILSSLHPNQDNASGLSSDRQSNIDINNFLTGCSGLISTNLGHTPTLEANLGITLESNGLWNVSDVGTPSKPASSGSDPSTPRALSRCESFHNYDDDMCNGYLSGHIAVGSTHSHGYGYVPEVAVGSVDHLTSSIFDHLES